MLTLKLVDTRRSGRFDEFQYYEGGKLKRIGRDINGDGTPGEFRDVRGTE